MKKLLLLTVFTCSYALFSQEKFTLSGTISDKNSNETLIGVTIYIPELQTGTMTNEYGFYSITLPKNTYKISISYVGYSSISETINLSKNIRKNFGLNETANQLEEVVIESNVEKLNIRTPQMSLNRLSSKTIKQIPVVLGEADIIKSITLLPGVTTAGEGASGFNVRGGAADQNLILLDEATVFNSSHVFGFFSVFNPDVIKDVSLYKGGIPARYGGRLASVLDIYQKEGNNKEFKTNGGIGLVSSRLLLEGPIKKEKSAFLIGGRASYAHLFLALTNNKNKAYFYDVNTKINFKINDNNNLYFSGYFGKDIVNISGSFVNSYGNNVANLRWNHLFSDKLFSNLSLIYSDYFYGLELDFIGFDWKSGIENFNIKYDFKHYLSNKLKLQYGINNIYLNFNPGKIKPLTKDSGIVENQLTKKNANELGIYVEADHKISEKLRLQYGIRFSNFTRLGQRQQNVYTNDNPVIFNSLLQKYQEAVPIGIENFKTSDVIKNFSNFEPRFSASYLLNEKASVKLSYNRMAQYLHLISNTSSPTPLDIWTPSGKFLKPQLLNQYAIGYFNSFSNRKYTIEIESFYKNIKNRIDYINGANLVANNQLETIILNGKARAYGLEVLLKKNKGKVKGWLAYTLSKSEQLTAGRTPEETGINKGKWYNTPYDKTHDLSINASYELNKKWTFNTNLIFQTGQPTNYPTEQYTVQGLNIPIYDDDRRNGDRLPTYHRIDIAATLTPRKNANRKWKGEWVFGIYNIYNRKNAASIAFSRNRENLRNEAVKTSIFGIVPSVTYNFKF